MATRRHGREWALQMLVQADLNPGMNLDNTIPRFWQQQWTCRMEEKRDRGEKTPENSASPADQVAPRKIRMFAETLVRGVIARQDELDAKIESYARNWAVYRIGSVERNVLRLAFYELLFCPDVPAPVVLNEAIDLAKYFSNAEAGRFVNGIIDRLNKDLHGSRK
ncbi:MAG: transcription antitermination factor NusB [Kiritimatiellia bacterium]